jgi:putative nucleotidyltransferase with HDIG domain
MGERPRILIVDDEAPIRDLCARILAPSYDVVTAGSGAQAIALAASSPPDLLLTDLKMPGMTGLEAARQIVTAAPDVSVVVMTGFSEFDSLLETVRFGVNGFLMKPFSAEDLRKTVEEGLRKGLYYRKNTRLRSLTPLLDIQGTRLADVDQGRMFQVITETALQELEADEVTLVSVDEDGREVVVAASAAGGAAPQGDTDHSAYWRVRADELAREAAALVGGAPGSTLSLPLQVGENVLGVLSARRARAPFTAPDRDVLRLICAQGAIAVENIRLFKRLRRSYWNTVYALAATVELRDHPTRGHSDRLAAYAVSIGRRLGLPPERIEDLKIAALLHDIGKIGIGDGILLKPGDLTAEEYDWMKTHTLMGARILAMADFSPRVVEAVLFHHERWDGTGYPLGLTGEQIPVEARILTAADALESMTSARSYRAALPVEHAVGELVRGRGTQFDPRVVDALLECLRAGELAPLADPAGAAADAS